MIVHQFAPNDQAIVRAKPSGSKGRKRTNHAWDVLPVVPHYAMHTNAPTLAQVQDAAAGAFARLLVAYFTKQDTAATACGEGVQHGA